MKGSSWGPFHVAFKNLLWLLKENRFFKKNISLTKVQLTTWMIIPKLIPKP